MLEGLRGLGARGLRVLEFKGLRALGYKLPVKLLEFCNTRPFSKKKRYLLNAITFLESTMQLVFDPKGSV